MKNFSHITIMEGNIDILDAESKKFCINVLGDKFKNKIKKSICSDIIFIDSGKNKSIGIGEVRKIKNDTLIKPVECEFKIYVFKNAQNLTEQAQNALLKIFEEPPKHVVFLLLCSNFKKLIPTVISRARILKLSGDDSNNTSKDIDNFLDFLTKEDKLNAMSIISKYDSDREKLKKFLNDCNNNLLSNIKNQIFDIDKIYLCKKINRSIHYLNDNLSIKLSSILIFSD